MGAITKESLMNGMRNQRALIEYGMRHTFVSDECLLSGGGACVISYVLLPHISPSPTLWYYETTTDKKLLGKTIYA